VDLLHVVIAVVTGLVLGSFYNVVIYRLPRRLSPLAPRSFCPSCERTLEARDLVPLLSYVVLGGRCRFCKSRISVAYPLVEAGTALGFAVLAARSGLGWEWAFYALFFSLLVMISAIDLSHRVIPNVLTGSGVLGGAALLLASGGAPLSLQSAGLGLLVGGGTMLVIVLLSFGGMGAGDMKMAALMGFYLGWPGVAVALFASFCIGALVGLMLIILRIKGRKDAIPFGPFLALGSLIALFWAEPLIDWYLGYLYLAP